MADSERRIRMAIIAGASRALKFRNQKPHSTEDEVLRHVTSNLSEILENIDNPL